MEQFVNLAFENEMMLGIDCIRKGLLELSSVIIPAPHYYIPLLLISNGIEKLLKTLYCFNNYNIEKNKATFNKLKNKISHSLIKLKKHYEKILKDFDAYKRIEERKLELYYLINDSTLKRVFDVLEEFNNTTRFYNLNYILLQNCENPNYYIENPCVKLSNIITDQKINEIKNSLSGDNVNISDVNFCPIIYSIQKLLIIIANSIVCGAISPCAPQLSIASISKYLNLPKDTDLCNVL